MPQVSFVPQNKVHIPPVVGSMCDNDTFYIGSGAGLSRGTHWSMVGLYNINPDGVYDGQRSLEDFQFDLENVLTLSQLVGKSAEERNAAAVMLEILAGTKNKTAAEVAAEVVTDATKNGQRVLHVVLAANTAGRAEVIVREDSTKNGAWGLGQAARKVWSRLGCDEFHRSVPTQLAEREAVRRRVVRLGQEGLEASTKVAEFTSD